MLFCPFAAYWHKMRASSEIRPLWGWFFSLTCRSAAIIDTKCRFLRGQLHGAFAAAPFFLPGSGKANSYHLNGEQQMDTFGTKSRIVQIGDHKVHLLKSTNGGWLLYAPLRSFLAKISNRFANDLINDIKLNDKSSEIRQSINRIQSVISSKQKVDISNNLIGAITEITNFDPVVIGLAVTMRCNLACTYCHADAGDCLDLDPDIGKAALDFVIKNAVRLKDKVEVSLGGGGEPTVTWDLLRTYIEHLESSCTLNKVDWEVSMATNGILTPDKREYIKKHFNWFSLSFDGPEDIQNKQRPFASGKPSYPIVYETAKYFHNINFPFAIRSTVSAKSVHRLTEIVEFFHKEFPGVGIGLEPLHKIGRGKDSESGSPDMKIFTTQFLKAKEYSDNNNIRLVNSGVGRSGEIRTSFCKSLSAPAFNVSFDGVLTACQRDGGTLDEFKYGSWNKTKRIFDWDFEKIRKIRELAATLEPGCLTCFARYHCAGDCLDIKLAGSNRCDFNREIVRHMLTEKLLE